MPSTVTVTVKSSGGDYASLNAAIGGEGRDLPAADEICDIACYSFTDTTTLIVSGFTTDSTRYIRVYTPSSERHAGVWSSSKYNLSVDATNPPIEINEDYVRLEGLQISAVRPYSGLTYGVMLEAMGATAEVHIQNCLIKLGTYCDNSTCAGIRCMYVSGTNSLTSVR